jgi:signal transduction histidine kinase
MQHPASELQSLLQDVHGVPPATRVETAADLFLDPTYERLLSLPLVEDGQAVGIVSRFQLNQIFLRRFGREVFGRQPLSSIMNRRPLVVSIEDSLDTAARFITENIGSPLREDFILTYRGHYCGMGRVLDLLRAMQTRLADNALSLSSAYTDLKASQTQLVQSEKMASLGQMVAGIAHEINTPLGYVRNNIEMLQSIVEQLCQVLRAHTRLAEMLESGVPSENAFSSQLSETRALSADMHQSGLLQDTPDLLKDTLYGVDQIKSLVIGLRNFSRLDQAAVADVDLNECLDRTLVIANHLLKDRIEVKKRYSALPPVNCSPSQINQVLLNLLSNGVQAIEHDRGCLLLKTEASGPWVHVSIQDNGKGIAQEHLQKIFDPFFTTKPVGQGTGLGLSISHQIVQAHGGTIRVVSSPGRGSRFVISLPAARAAEGACASTRA